MAATHVRALVMMCCALAVAVTSSGPEPHEGETVRSCAGEKSSDLVSAAQGSTSAKGWNPAVLSISANDGKNHLQVDIHKVLPGTDPDDARQALVQLARNACAELKVTNAQNCSVVDDHIRDAFTLQQTSFIDKRPGDTSVYLDRQDDGLADNEADIVLANTRSSHAATDVADEHGTSEAPLSSPAWLVQKTSDLAAPKWQQAFQSWKSLDEQQIAAISDDYRVIYLKTAKNAGTTILNGYLHCALCPASRSCKVKLLACVDAMTPTAQHLGMISAENDRDVRILLDNSGGPARRNLGRTKCSKVAFRRSHAYFVHSTRFGCATSPLPPKVPTSDFLVDDQSACMVDQIPVYRQPTKVCKRKIFSGATRFANPSFYVSPDCPPSRFQIVTVDKIPLAKFQQYLVFAFARDPVSRALSMFTYCRGTFNATAFQSFLRDPNDAASWGGTSCSSLHFRPQEATWSTPRLGSGPKATLVDILGRCDRLNQHLQMIVDLVNRGRRVDLPPLPSVHKLVAKSNFDPKSKSQGLDRCDATCMKALRTGTFASDFVLWDRLSSF